MSEGITFTVGDIPPSSTGDPDDSPITSDDLTCEVCGTPLSYGGRGRKPKFCADHKPTAGTGTRSTPRSKGRDVDAAMAALDTTHTSLSFLLMLVAGDAAQAWEAGRPALDDRNRRILEADPKLAKKLATVAAKGGGPALVLSHLVAVAPVAGLAYGNIRVARDAKAQHAAAAMPDNVTDLVDRNMAASAGVPPVDPDAAFRRR